MTYPAEEPGLVDIGDRHFVWPQSDGTYLWWHDCPAPKSGTHLSWWWFGRSLDGKSVSGHVVQTVEPLTVQGSLLCTDCGDHGFVRDGRWVRA